MEGDNLKTFLEILFIAPLGSESNEEVKFTAAYRVTGSRRSKTKGREREVLMTFQEGSVKSMVMTALWDQPKLVARKQE